MSEDLDAKLKARFEDLGKVLLARLDQMEATLVEEFRQSTKRINSISRLLTHRSAGLGFHRPSGRSAMTQPTLLTSRPRPSHTEP